MPKANQSKYYTALYKLKRPATAEEVKLKIKRMTGATPSDDAVRSSLNRLVQWGCVSRTPSGHYVWEWKNGMKI